MDTIYSLEKSSLCHITRAAKQTWTFSPLRLYSKAHAQNLCKPHYSRLLTELAVCVCVAGWLARHNPYQGRENETRFEMQIAHCVPAQSRKSTVNVSCHFTKTIQICPNVEFFFFIDISGCSSLESQETVTIKWQNVRELKRHALKFNISMVAK